MSIPIVASPIGNAIAQMTSTKTNRARKRATIRIDPIMISPNIALMQMPLGVFDVVLGT